MTDALTADEQAQLAYTFRVRHPGVVAMDTRPTVLYRVTTDHAGNVIMRDLRAEAQRIPVRRDVDDEPWGDPVGLGMPRPRPTGLLVAVLRMLLWKYRRVW